MAARLAFSKATSASPSCLSKLCRLLSGCKHSLGSGMKPFVSPAKRTSGLSEKSVHVKVMCKFSCLLHDHECDLSAEPLSIYEWHADSIK